MLWLTSRYSTNRKKSRKAVTCNFKKKTYFVTIMY